MAAMFSSTPGDAGAPRAAGESSLSILAGGMKITGEFETDGVVKIEGKIEGTVKAKQQVLVARGGVVEGDIHTKDAVVGGNVRGAIVAEGRVEVQAGASIEGDITTPVITVQEGGSVNGALKMTAPNKMKTAGAGSTGSKDVNGDPRRAVEQLVSSSTT